MSWYYCSLHAEWIARWVKTVVLCKYIKPLLARETKEKNYMYDWRRKKLYVRLNNKRVEVIIVCVYNLQRERGRPTISCWASLYLTHLAILCFPRHSNHASSLTKSHPPRRQHSNEAGCMASNPTVFLSPTEGFWKGVENREALSFQRSHDWSCDQREWVWSNLGPSSF